MREHLLPSSQSLGISLSNVVSARAELDDMQLIAASKKGDQDAFAQLVQRYQRRVFNLVYRMLQHYEEANEITQETFLAAWQGLPAFRGDARFPTWLYRIAYNCSLKSLEQRKRDKALQEALQAEQVLERAYGDKSADAQLEMHDRQAFIQELIARLPTKYRVVLILRHLQDMTYEEMAEILTMPIGTIKTHLFRARNLLKERLQTLDRDRFLGTRGS
ncbi:MAG TPA: sigma-70 family RNA polymerase sigma factor [Ktedonobacteraceae bacterium]|jgi:RNA polymerase sigma-70 factor (ECF subfamily)|nr:sigma-70 family RNA polymerase sigma factor [Ktedonobacteraceae bacterium]